MKRIDTGPVFTEDTIKRMAKEMKAEHNKKMEDFHYRKQTTDDLFSPLKILVLKRTLVLAKSIYYIKSNYFTSVVE